jgi:rhodanese-related sulfurtransferase
LYDSLFDGLLKQDDSLLVYPGHGAGSLCGRSIGSVRFTTLGFERRNNPSLSIKEKDRFVAYMTSNLPEQPGNHRRIKEMNRRGPKLLGDVQRKPVAIRDSIPYFQKGTGLLDLRSKEEYVQLHVPGSVHLPADEQLSNKIGFVLHPDQPVILLLENEADYVPVIYSLARVGYDNVVGYLEEGIQGWQAARLPTTSGDIQDVSAAELNDLLKNGANTAVVDVREPWEFVAGHIPGAVLIPLGELANRIQQLDPAKPVAVVCASGSRSQSAAALLGQKGFAKVYNLQDGMYGWQMAGFEVSTNEKK